MRQSACDSPLNYRIRVATADDIDDLSYLEDICFKEEKFSKRQVRSLLMKAKSVVLVANINNSSIIGSIIVLLRKHISNARIYSLNVHPDYRREGIADSLMEFAFGLLRKDGYRTITLEVGIHNTPAQNLYRSKDFIKKKKIPGYYKNGDDAFRLIKIL